MGGFVIGGGGGATYGISAAAFLAASFSAAAAAAAASASAAFLTASFSAAVAAAEAAASKLPRSPIKEPDSRSLASAAEFLQVIRPHASSDVTVTCRRAGVSSAVKGGVQQRGEGCSPCPRRVTEVLFFCHRSALARVCPRFGGGAERQASEAAGPLTKRRRTVEAVDADDDIVFEVLRFIYCGTLHFPRGLLGRLGQLLRVAEQFGLEVRVPPTPAPQTPPSGHDACGGPAAAPDRAVGGLLADQGMQRFLRGAPSKELYELVRGSPAPSDAGASPPLPRARREELLSLLSRLRPEEFSVEALRARGSDFEDLLHMHPGLVHVKVFSLSGATVLEQTLDRSSPAKRIKAALYDTSWAEDAGLSLVFGEDVLDDATTLEDLGAAGFGCCMDLNMVRTAIKHRHCLCNQPASRILHRKPGPHQGRAFFRCSGLRGVQCPFFEWTD
mmetsp:Transcript_64079/g.172190  ORF Transcript_64079/g.172190 Transcript_64079/m.172190 type:complete len:444 (+) Transcript_64079:407-1738(+)